MDIMGIRAGHAAVEGEGYNGYGVIGGIHRRRVG